MLLFCSKVAAGREHSQSSSIPMFGMPTTHSVALSFRRPQNHIPTNMLIHS
jgi:hypothetical protein